jgi:hypothetical protein
MKNKLLIGISIFYFLPLMLTILQGCTSCFGEKFEPRYYEITRMYLRNASYLTPAYPEEVFIQIETETRNVAHQIHQSSGYNLMACNPPEPEPKHIFTNIEIYSNKDFEGFPAGTNLAPLFAIGTYKLQYNVVDFLKQKPKTERFYLLGFENNALPISGIHQFKIIFTDSKNTVFEMNAEVNFK